MKEKFSVTGMTCSACSAGIERTLNKKAGVKKAEVFLMSESMTVEYDEKIISKEEIIACVVALGYGASPYDPKNERAKSDKTEILKKRFLISLIFLIPLLYFSMGGMIRLPQPSEKINYTLQLCFTLIVMAINFRFFTNGTKALIHGVANMDTLVSLGSLASFLYSLVLTIGVYVGKIAHAHMFYESAAMILTLVTLGKWLEERSSKRTGVEVEKLIRLMPDTVTVEKDGKQSQIPFSDIEKGDTLVVKQGDYIPVDGSILEGSAFVDRAAVTGESMPLEVSIGDLVTGADIVKSGFLKIKAERVGADTTLSKIVRMVKEAGASKAPIQKIADKIAGVFVPAVTLIAVITFLIWISVSSFSVAANYAISVLVISCPCALGLATPVAVMAATGKGMSLGILYKDAEALQKAERIDCVLLVKTATLTVGAPVVTDFACICEQADRESLLRLAASIEAKSNHPIAECIKQYAETQVGEEKIAIENYRYETGKGAIAEWDGKTYSLGNEKLLNKLPVGEILKKANAYAEEGKTVVYLLENGETVALFALADTLKETSKEAVKALHDAKIRTAMLTGDNERVAAAVAKKVGIEEYFASALPEDKAAAVERVRSVGGYVAMVGDGINDSPALKAADVGIAMGTGTDVAIDSADIVLVGGDLNAVKDAIDLSKAAVKNIRQNLFWAFFYNCVAIPVAAGAFAFLDFTLNPMIAAACMSLSSLFVVTNALRLNRFKGRQRGEQVVCTNGCNVQKTAVVTKETEKNIDQPKETVMKKIMKIEGMMCQHCVRHVKTALEGVSGVESVEVDLEKKSATVLLKEDISGEILSKAVTDAGYDVISDE